MTQARPDGAIEELRLLAVLRALGEHGVRYAVFGAVALGLHGLARTTADLDLFVEPTEDNVERLKAALRSVYADPCIDEISAADLCGDYPAVRYGPPEGFGFDIVTRLGEAFSFAELAVEVKRFQGVEVRVVTPHQLWEMKRSTVRPIDQADAAALAARFALGDG
jgi:predicted nucleotidyltransferase